MVEQKRPFKVSFNIPLWKKTLNIQFGVFSFYNITLFSCESTVSFVDSSNTFYFGVALFNLHFVAHIYDKGDTLFSKVL
jgi:hypothetical protein